MLHAERIFEEQGIQEELDAYNPLVPDGRNLKATMMIEYPDPDERGKRLADLIGIEDKVWLQVAGTSGSGRLPTKISIGRMTRKPRRAFLAFRARRGRGPGVQKRRGLDDRGRSPALHGEARSAARLRDALALDLA